LIFLTFRNILTFLTGIFRNIGDLPGFQLGTELFFLLKTG